jgi:hypothetical protein
MRSLLRWLVAGGALGVGSLCAVSTAWACADAAWHLSSNSVSCVTAERAGDFTQSVKNTCPVPLQLTRRDQSQLGTANLTIAPGAAGELALPAPANEGDKATYDCIAGAQAGELGFAFSEGDCGGCTVSRHGGASPLGAVGALGTLASLTLLTARRRRAR